jgi:hypothetical protein
MERHAGAREMHPLGHGFKVVDRFARLNLDKPGKLLPVRQDEVGEERGCTELDWSRLFLAEVHGDIELPLVLRLEVANKSVVFELLTNRAYEDGRHAASAD